MVKLLNYIKNLKMSNIYIVCLFQQIKNFIMMLKYWQDVGGLDYPVYRPTKRVSEKTPLTTSEINPSNLKKQISLKQEIKGEYNLPKFKEKK
jgi:hypothetical protein